MAVDASLLEMAAAGGLGLALSVLAECLLKPRPPLIRPGGAWCAHLALWCATYGLLVLLSGRPWCAMLAVTAIVAMLVLVSNAKYKSLREPFIFQDYDYFLDALRYPRLFLPFLGVKGFMGIAAGFALALLGLLLEAPPEARFDLNGQLGGAVALLAAAFVLLWRLKAYKPALCFAPDRDMRDLGLLGSLWAYAVAEGAPPAGRSPFADCPGRARERLPHLIAIQSESFFDARTLHSGIRPDILAAFDALRAESWLHGPLSVPAWGANTVRTEFAFLTGIAEEQMGVHRFNPYKAVTRGWSVGSLPLFLKSLGYRTICIHPYWAHFYGRDRVLRRLGFDAFMDVSAFAGAQRVGAYVGDMAVGERILEVLRQAVCPTFVFAITMENHGPLHMEPYRPEAAEALYTAHPPAGCEELAAYLHHLRNADNMLGMLATGLRQTEYPASMCFYGDHVPIMPATYKILQAPEGMVPYFCWDSQHPHDVMPQSNTESALTPGVSPGSPLSVHDLALRWLEAYR